MIVDDRFYLCAIETPEDVSVQLHVDERGQRYVLAVKIALAAMRAAKSLGYRGSQIVPAARGIVRSMNEGLKAEGVEVRQ